MKTKTDNVNRKRAKAWILFVGFLALITDIWHFPTAQAASTYGLKIVAPIREDTAKNPDMNLGPALKDLQNALKEMTGREYSLARGDGEYNGAGIFLVRANSPTRPLMRLQNSKAVAASRF